MTQRIVVIDRSDPPVVARGKSNSLKFSFRIVKRKRFVVRQVVGTTGSITATS